MPKDGVEDIDRVVGANLKKERERLGLTLAIVAERAGCSLQMVSHYEGGHERIYLTRLVKLARALRRPLTYFLRGTGVKIT